MLNSQLLQLQLYINAEHMTMQTMTTTGYVNTQIGMGAHVLSGEHVND
jgi:hypothetical protein